MLSSLSVDQLELQARTIFSTPHISSILDTLLKMFKRPVRHVREENMSVHYIMLTYYASSQPLNSGSISVSLYFSHTSLMRSTLLPRLNPKSAIGF